jgi:light-regulated signal transduction histidine kinase (bacteriophytochrome)
VDELKHSNAALEQFAYVASHDLQEPLRKIQTFGNVLKMKLGDNIAEDVRDLIGRMHASAGRMRVLIEDLLTYSRISAGNRPVEAIDMNRLLAEVINDLEQAIADKNAIISISELPTVHGDPLGFRQLFHNLLTNALKFTREGVKPEITITGKTVEGAKTGLQLPPSAMNASYHIFKISDNGIGFEPEHAERIFGMFQRLHGRSAYPGTGVGLSIVQKVTESHKGFFNAEGKPGQGATFRIAIPAGL